MSRMILESGYIALHGYNLNVCTNYDFWGFHFPVKIDWWWNLFNWGILWNGAWCLASSNSTLTSFSGSPVQTAQVSIEKLLSIMHESSGLRIGFYCHSKFLDIFVIVFTNRSIAQRSMCIINLTCVLKVQTITFEDSNFLWRFNNRQIWFQFSYILLARYYLFLEALYVQVTLQSFVQNFTWFTGRFVLFCFGGDKVTISNSSAAYDQVLTQWASKESLEIDIILLAW